jgi:hypothetical protein
VGDSHPPEESLVPVAARRSVAASWRGSMPQKWIHLPTNGYARTIPATVE